MINFDFFQPDKINVVQDTYSYLAKYMKFARDSFQGSIVDINDEIEKETDEPLYLYVQARKNHIFDLASKFLLNGNNIVILSNRIFSKKDLKPSFPLRLYQLRNSGTIVFISDSVRDIESLGIEGSETSGIINYFSVRVVPSKDQVINSFKSEICLINEKMGLRFLLGQKTTSFFLPEEL